ncbi:MaoC family dehydratase [Burkholderia pseudomultivorans]|uniref:Dehydratase n=1 Tax=Burkholderia pseudomultivorans TaxID=1207504 RepID=A0A132EJM8_9BURK|nr:MaoC family dehydratase [Burkholderia pseudomultivorans]KWF31256.1 dehydratase [Burkholderia pseudomultivorans]MDR8728669.1 putative enoyl-CoA hydratase 1 [Burkholderia pseudomultivorans]MDR8736835.1 putative enoyl-CoA hydratase 1 [Burkholderia pseudomultivorans]MDR8743285.1 putative enoyl-CoA hydratase 1 [Burkholderia pseudomultivorans]MDR8754960.1 putative enoyl-CoA hydratase 1 [Burkholderia pseudomultivorans]
MTDVTLPLIASAQALHARVGEAPLESGWIAIDQRRVDGFADATDDHQWIHVDPERARRESPFGGPIAHGFLTLSLIPALMDGAMRFEQKMGVNYGLNRVRFLKPVPVGARVRALFAVKETADAAQGGVQVTWSVSVQAERPGAPLLVCAAEFITLHYF